MVSCISLPDSGQLVCWPDGAIPDEQLPASGDMLAAGCDLALPLAGFAAGAVAGGVASLPSGAPPMVLAGAVLGGYAGWKFGEEGANLANGRPAHFGHAARDVNNAIAAVIAMGNPGVLAIRSVLARGLGELGFGTAGLTLADATAEAADKQSASAGLRHLADPAALAHHTQSILQALLIGASFVKAGEVMGWLSAPLPAKPAAPCAEEGLGFDTPNAGELAFDPPARGRIKQFDLSQAPAPTIKNDGGDSGNSGGVRRLRSEPKWPDGAQIRHEIRELKTEYLNDLQIMREEAAAKRTASRLNAPARSGHEHDEHVELENGLDFVSAVRDRLARKASAQAQEWERTIGRSVEDLSINYSNAKKASERASRNLNDYVKAREPSNDDAYLAHLQQRVDAAEAAETTAMRNYVSKACEAIDALLDPAGKN